MFTPSMTDMRRSPEEKQATGVPVSCGGSDYPYGLAISLDDESLKKLDVDFDSIEIGETYHLFVMAKVTAKSRNERDAGEPRECVELQITHMGAESEDAENEQSEAKEPLSKKLYSK